ncbi:MAG: hemerythrin family protein, partial [Geobacteraceae bacterium]|nr:hemerythrin family protein [Geobacteraceae bacterium]
IEIDEQHQELFERFERLSKACQEGGGNEVVADLLCYLEEYVDHHFAVEERLMSQHKYQGLPEQRQLHQEFREKVVQLRDQFETEGASRSLAIVIDGSLVRWLIQHIGNTDRKMIECLKPLLT